MTSFSWKQFLIVTLITSIWVHASEVFRYFVFVIPRIQSFWDNAPGVAIMNLPIFSIWGAWDMILTSIIVFVFWMYAQIFGNNFRSSFFSATITWLAIFVIFWIAAANMGLSNWSILLIALPLSWLELVIASWIASRLFALNRWRG